MVVEVFNLFFYQIFINFIYINLGICYFSCMNHGTLGDLYKIEGNLDGK